EPLIELGLTLEMLPTERLADPKVWQLFLPTMGLTAMLRNLARMTASGALQPLSTYTKLVCNRLGAEDELRRSRVHPIQILAAALTYAQGHGMRGSLSWTPIGQINDCLDAAFYASFGNVKPSNKRLRVALDVSGSMDGGVITGIPGLTPRIASAALALI